MLTQLALYTHTHAKKTCKKSIHVNMEIHVLQTTCDLIKFCEFGYVWVMFVIIHCPHITGNSNDSVRKYVHIFNSFYHHEYTTTCVQKQRCLMFKHLVSVRAIGV